MTELVGMCVLCGKPAVGSCALCGARVCSDHFDASTGTCSSCRRGKVVGGTPMGTDPKKVMK